MPLAQLFQASTTVLGMMCIRNSETLCAFVCPAYSATALASSAAAFTLNALPGCTILPVARPMNSAKVDTSSKQTSAFPHRDQPNESVPQPFQGDRRRRPQVAQRDVCGSGEQHLRRRICVKSLLARIGRRHSGAGSYAAREVFIPLPRIIVNTTATTPSRAREWRSPNRLRTLPLWPHPPRGDRSKASTSSSGE